MRCPLEAGGCRSASKIRVVLLDIPAACRDNRVRCIQAAQARQCCCWRGIATNRMKHLFRRKDIAALQAEAHGDQKLHRALGPVNLTALGIGAIIGTGIFVLTGTVAAQNAGPAVVLSFVLAGLASVFAALCYSEVASLVPMAGSADTYGYATLGEFVA